MVTMQGALEHATDEDDLFLGVEQVACTNRLVWGDRGMELKDWQVASDLGSLKW